MKPFFKIVNSGKDHTESYTQILEELSIVQSTTDKADCFKIRISDIGNTIELPKDGQKVDVSLGDGSDANLLFVGSYVIDGVELKGPPDTIEITGSTTPFSSTDGLQAMQTRRSRSWDNITIGDLVRGIAAEHGLEPVISSDYENTVIFHLDQTNESNLNLLSRLARTFGASFKPGFKGNYTPNNPTAPTTGKLAFTSANTGMAANGAAMGVLAIARGPGMRWTAAFSKRTQFSAVKVSYYDQDFAQTIDVTAGMTAEQAAIPWAKTYHERFQQPTKAEAQAKAWSKLRELKRGSRVISLDLPGLYRVAADQKVSLVGWRSEINGVWIAKRIEFTLTKAAGLRTHIDCETPGNDDPADGEAARENLFGNDEEPASDSDTTDGEEEPEN